MIKIEDIFDCIIGNWDVYKELLDKDNFVPVVGAGLSIDMGIGGWNQLITSLAEYVFDFGRAKNKTDDKLEEELDISSQHLMLNCLDKLKELDMKDIECPSQTSEHVDERIKSIKCFVEESSGSGENRVNLQYVFFKKLLNRGTFFSSYEAAELLKVVNDDERHFMKCLYRIINKSKKEKDWEIEKDKAVYWLAEVLKILRNSKKEGDIDNIADCFTTNYDDILESACLKDFASKVKVEHLHGYFDVQKEPHDICLTLSDLLGRYQERLNNKEARIDNNRGIGLMESGNNDVPFLFLGTSFSESHIGQLARPRPSYGIAPLPNNNDDMDSLREKMKKFKIGKDATIFYPVDKKSHEALVILLHQLARDLSHGFWNNWFFKKHFPKQIKPFTDEEVEMVDKTISWLKDSRKCILYIKKGENLKFDTAEEVGNLEYNNSGILYFICEKLEEEFKRPEWSEYCEIEEIFKEGYLYKEDLEPLGNTIYIYRKEEGFEDQWVKFKRQIENWYSEEGRERWKYKIVRFILSYEERKSVRDAFTMCAVEKSKEKSNYSKSHDIELAPLYGGEIWDRIMAFLSVDMKFQEIEKGDKERNDFNLPCQDSREEEWKNNSNTSAFRESYSHQYDFSKENNIPEKFDGKASIVGDSLKENDDIVSERENEKKLTKKI